MTPVEDTPSLFYTIQIKNNRLLIADSTRITNAFFCRRSCEITLN